MRRFNVLLFAVLLLPIAAHAQADANAARSPLEQLRTLPPYHMDEVLWLARCLLSESDRPDEQELVAWVVRNRVETGYRGRTYREVVLEPRQFSAFNADTDRRAYLLSLDQEDRIPSWRRAVEIALAVYQAPASERPFSQTTRHFYSPISMTGGRTPPWARGETPVAVAGIDAQRFRFFDGIDERLDPPGPVATAPPILTRGDDTPPTRLRSRRRPTLSGKVPRPARPQTPTRRGNLP